MEIALWLAGLAFCSWVGVTGLILSIPTARRLKDEGGLPWVLTVPAYIALFLGLVWDVVFNVLVGTVIFRELPREFVFTDRVKRHVKERNPRSIFWRDLINRIDEGHI